MDRRTFLQGTSIAALCAAAPGELFGVNHADAAPAPLAAKATATVAASNGGRLQINFNFLQAGGDYAFLNFLKTAQEWSFVDSTARPTAPAPDTLDSDGYPLKITNGGISTVFYIPSQDPVTGRPGNYVVTWEGDGTISTPGTPVSGSPKGLNGRYEFVPANTRVVFSIVATNLANRLHNVQFFHSADEARLKAGEVFGVDFKNRLAQANFGVYRFLNWQNGNTSNVTTWATRKPISYAYYAGVEFRGSIYAGTTTNVSDNFSISFGSGAPQDKQTLIVLFNTTASTVSPTLNLNGTGPIPIRNSYGATLADAEKPSPRYAALTYDGVLKVWLKTGGDATNFNQGLNNGVPPEICLRLCIEMGAHPWFVTPCLAVDPATDFISSLANYCRSNAPSWMVPRYEVVPNETWNAAFYATQLGYQKAKLRWPAGGNYNIHNWVGMVGSIGGQAVSQIYANDRTKYQAICGVQQSSDPAASNDRLAATNFVSEGKTPAYKWITHIAPACYFGASYTCAQEVAAAYKFSVADAATKAQIASDFVNSTLISSNFNGATGPIALKLASFGAWKVWSSNFGVGITAYEGGWSPDFPSTNSTSPISSASNAAQCVIVLATTSSPNNPTSTAGNGAVVGMSLKISNVAGMTELNGNIYTVTAVNGNNVTINVDSRNFGRYLSGGTANYQNDATNRTALRSASKTSLALYGAWTKFYGGLFTLGINFPSVFQLAGKNNVWSILDPDIYTSPQSSQWSAIQLYRK
ncbi:hypothetical protein [Bradyrhizobium sp. USDA 4469]